MAKHRPTDIATEFQVSQLRLDEPLPADYNVAPSKPVYAVLSRTVTQERAERESVVERQLRVVTWGLVPSWAKDPKIGNRLVNARIETAGEKPAFRGAFARRRCILPADGYYEWYTPEGDAQRQAGSRRPPKQPFYIHRADGGMLAMAGLYELWRDPAKDRDDPTAWRWTTVVLTTQAADALGRIHDRMPLLVPSDAYDQWLDPRPVSAETLGSLVPAAEGTVAEDAGSRRVPEGGQAGHRLVARPVSTEVNNVRNNGPQLIDEVPPEHAPPP